LRGVIKEKINKAENEPFTMWFISRSEATKQPVKWPKPDSMLSNLRFLLMPLEGKNKVKSYQNNLK